MSAGASTIGAAKSSFPAGKLIKLKEFHPYLVPVSKNEWSYTSTPPNPPSWRGTQLKSRVNFTFNPAF